MQSRNPPDTDRKTIRLDYSGMMSEYVGDERGINPREIDELKLTAQDTSAKIDEKNDSGEYGFYRLPYDSQTEKEVRSLADSYREKCDDFVVLGIGGSSLGARALFSALAHPMHNLVSRQERKGAPRIFFLDNIDSLTVNSILDYINPEKTVFNVVTRSGTTVETISQFLIVRDLLCEKLGDKSAAEHIVVTTGERDNTLRTLAEKNGYPLLTIPDNVGGRFSVFTPAGLFPASMAGIDTGELLSGARFADGICRTGSLQDNPAYMSGALHYLADTRKGLNIHVMMPYSDALVQAGYWFRQLWAESLGKRENISGETIHSGQTPVIASGVTDQHSQLQLFTEGPFDKMITFLKVEDHGESLNIPDAPEDDYRYLGGHSFNELMNIEMEATRLALIEEGRSSMSLIIPGVNPFTVGQLLFMLEVQTVFTAGLYNVEPMNQPGVEASKRHIREMLGRTAGGTDPGRNSPSTAGRYII